MGQWGSVVPTNQLGFGSGPTGAQMGPRCLIFNIMRKTIRPRVEAVQLIAFTSSFSPSHGDTREMLCMKSHALQIHSYGIHRPGSPLVWIKFPLQR
ncbi:Uncharacterized protein TCM_037399 [Theobroma cacao]|uniref:Uncharacterized protein n=1 Tax=Theobroma cacao TaxID=3641 RepID=A0A061GLP5_THECC|nr:Uncharacterized protein TCM_037399 [Theobroma cacao]